jgi:hypothetical protein
MPPLGDKVGPIGADRCEKIIAGVEAAVEIERSASTYL